MYTDKNFSEKAIFITVIQSTLSNTLLSGTATYKSSSKTAGYSLASNGKSISYTKATAASTLATVKGVKSKDGLSVSEKVVTVAASALNKSKVTISGGYTLALASDVSITAKAKTDWSYKSSVATLTQTKGEKCSLAGNKKSISYTAGTSKNLAKLSGVNSKEGHNVEHGEGYNRRRRMKSEFTATRAFRR